ncbi:MAG: response regulator [Candidatus Promineifilaceae bacterium]
MSHGRILVVEDDPDIGDILELAFRNAGYGVELARTGENGLILARKRAPDLIVLDINLPGMDGYDVCRQLRLSARTSHIPIMFLTNRDERSDRIAGLELGADDYITKPFDIEELGLRVKNAIQSHRRANMTDPRTSLPAARLIEDQLRRLTRSRGWTYLEVSVEQLDPFQDTYGFVATDEVLRYVALLLSEVASEFGTNGDFIGHAGGATFVLITWSESAEELAAELRRRFDDGISAHYAFLDVERGGIQTSDGGMMPLMRLSVGLVDNRAREFTDIREITESAAEMRSLDRRLAGR